MQLKGIDIHEMGNQIFAHVRGEEKSLVTFCKKTDDCHLRWLWEMLKAEAKKGSFEKDGEWL